MSQTTSDMWHPVTSSDIIHAGWWHSTWETSEISLSFGFASTEVAMSVGFLACGCGFYGLNYSAGQLSPSVYVSTSLLHGGDIVGYTLALSADKYGRNLVQARSSGSFADFFADIFLSVRYLSVWFFIAICTEALAFFVATMCLLLCSTGEPGSALVLSAAVMGRLCLDVCFTTVYVGLGAIFSGSTAKTALMICEATARLGGIIAPLSGTWPTSVSWLKAVTISMSCGEFWKQVLPCDVFLELTVRWGLLDFAPRAPTAIICAQCSLPNLNRDHPRPDRMSGDMSGRMSGDFPEDMSETMSAKMSQHMSARMSDRLPGDMPEGMSERMSEDMWEGMSDRMSGNMSEMSDHVRRHANNVRRNGRRDVEKTVRRYARKNVTKNARKNFTRYVRKNVRRAAGTECQEKREKMWQEECQQECQKECQTRCQKQCQEVC